MYLEAVQQKWGWFLALGILLMILGFATISVPQVATLTIELFVGWMLVVAGIIQIVHAFGAGKWEGFFLSLLGGVLSLGVGVMLLAYPLRGVVTLTILLGMFFFAEGLYKIVMSLNLRPMPGWGWVLTSGIIALVLAGLILDQLPSSAAWAIGLLVGIDLLFTGLAMTMLSLTARGIARHAYETR